jgi:probable selenium-dependent hydroxylase accessory protein YqeC
MQIADALGLAHGMTLSLVGAGGKTSLIFSLAGELAAQGHTLLVTTTTAMFHPDHGSPPNDPPSGWPYARTYDRPYDRLVIGNIQALCRSGEKTGQIVVAAKSHDPKTHKLKGYCPDVLTRVWESRVFDYILIEADGSKRLPIKAPADHEPVIPLWTDMVIGCVGLDCLGRPLDAHTVHRPEHLAAVTGQPPGSILQQESILSLVASSQGLFKHTSQKMKKIVLLNKADTREHIQAGQALARRISRECPGVDNCLVACLLDKKNPIYCNPALDKWCLHP